MNGQDRILSRFSAPLASRIVTKATKTRGSTDALDSYRHRTNTFQSGNSTKYNYALSASELLTANIEIL